MNQCEVFSFALGDLCLVGYLATQLNLLLSLKRPVDSLAYFCRVS